MLTDLVVRGVALQELGVRRGYTVGQGQWIERSWKGTAEEILELEPIIYSAGFSYEIQEGPLWTLVARAFGNIPGEPELTEKWSYAVVTSEKNILESNDKIVSSLSERELKGLKGYYENPLTNVKPPVHTPNGKIIAQLLEYGVTTKNISQLVFRLSVIADINADLSDYIFWNNKVLSNNEFITGEGLPTNYIALVPDDTNPGPLFGDMATITMEYGWLKNVTQVDDYSYSRLVLNIEWVYGLYPRELYDFVSA